MKLLYLIGVLITFQIILAANALQIPAHLQAQAKKLHNLCQKETGVAMELIHQSHKGSIPDDRTLQCYMHCLLDKVGLIDANHEIHLENLIEVLPEEFHAFVQKLVNSCGTKLGADGCETAYLTVKCYFESDPAVFANQFDFIFE